MVALLKKEAAFLAVKVLVPKDAVLPLLSVVSFHCGSYLDHLLAGSCGHTTSSLTKNALLHNNSQLNSVQSRLILYSM